MAAVPDFIRRHSPPVLIIFINAGLNRVERMTQIMILPARSDRPTLKFGQLSVIWNPRRRQSASVGQQDTLDYNWGELYRSTGPRADGVTEIATGIWGDVAVGKANSSNAEPVETAIRTPRMGHSIVEWEVMTGT
jgi:hypothetical protein